VKYTWTERLALRALRFIPRMIADAPERVLINFAAILIGLAGLLTPISPASLLARWPHWLIIEWSLSMLFGGLAALIGLGTRRWSLERLGVSLLGLATAFYGFNLIVGFWPRGLLSGLIFLGIAAAKTVRFIVASAARARLFHPPEQPPPSDTENH
jgi:hypothetical protein